MSENVTIETSSPSIEARSPHIEVNHIITDHKFCSPFFSKTGTVIEVCWCKENGQFEIMAYPIGDNINELDLRKADFCDIKEIIRRALQRMDVENQDSVIFELKGRDQIEFI